MRAKAHNYSEADKQFVIDHYNQDTTPAACAARIGVSIERLKKRVSDWRKAGIEIAAKGHRVGTIVEWKNGDRIARRLKTEYGWEYIGKGNPKSRTSSSSKLQPVKFLTREERAGAKIQKQQLLVDRKAQRDKVRHEAENARQAAKELRQRKKTRPTQLQITLAKRKHIDSPSAQEEQRKQVRKQNIARQTLEMKPQRTDLISLRINDRTSIMVGPEELEAKKQKYGLTG